VISIAVMVAGRALIGGVVRCCYARLNL